MHGRKMNISLNSKNITDQKTLFKIENLCTQEDPPACVAKCPLHVNVPKIINYIKNNEWDNAFLIYSKAIPFPNIISHCCDAPCKNYCKREEIGGAIEIQKLEEAIINNSKVGLKPPIFLPKKNKSIGIIGGGLRGMTSSLELCRKGYGVSIYEKSERLGGNIYETGISEDIIKKDIDYLLHFPVKVNYNNYISTKSEDIKTFIDNNSFDAIYITCNMCHKDKETLRSIGNVFFNENVKSDEDYSPIFSIYKGKSIGISIDRFLQNVSISSGREKEGPFDTKLFVNLNNFKSESPITPSESSYTELEAKMEGERCIQCTCMECVKKCTFMAHYKSYPKRYVREVYNNLSIAMGIHHSNEMINSCSLCGQCGNVCPNGLNMADVFLAGRNKMTESNKMPPSTFEFALLDMEYSMGEEFHISKHQYGFNESKYVFFPGCQLGASEPELTKKVYKELCNNLEGGVGLILGCCGVMAHWSGNEEKFKDAQKKIEEDLIKLGSPKIITACPTCGNVLNNMDNSSVISIYEVLNDIYDKKSNENAKFKEVYIHDACGTRNNECVQNSVRELLSKLNYNTINMKNSGKTSSCCGYGGLTIFSNQKLSNEIIKSQIVDLEEKKPVITYCVNCRDRYLSQNYESFHLLELIYHDVKTIHTSPTWSSRQENRSKLKIDMLREIWRERIDVEDIIKLYFDEGIEEKLEEDMILKSDVLNVIKNATLNNECFLNPKNNHYTACTRPGNVTFWVEYSKCDDGYKIHNVYSHRMFAEYSKNIVESVQKYE